MIARLIGKIIEKDTDRVIVENSGIGYEIVIPTNFLTSINEGDRVVFFIAEHIKEDEYTLFGFTDSKTRQMYYRLTSVNGVGPKAALAILSAHDSDEVQRAILNDEIVIFSSVSGIGKKTAQRIILELKGKLVISNEDESGQEDQAYRALVSLGFSAKDAKEALKGVDASLSIQERIKLGLKGVKND